MDGDDAMILRYLFRQLAPQRHLEFGTWRGDGALCCLTECEATVWTLNLSGGEKHPNGNWMYPASIMQPDERPTWLQEMIGEGRPSRFPSDALGLVGLHYLNAGYGHRVCQIHCDSREWDTQQYPAGFFDTVLIDGGHTREVVASDTRKAISLLRRGGVVMWHDFCPDPDVLQNCPWTVTVAQAINDHLAWLTDELTDLFWIKPSWLLVGIKA
jgi:predicted O-methyltransferase YrrM